MITASIVSHGHGKMVEEIAGQLANSDLITKIIVTLNIPENFELNNQKIILEKNIKKEGFGANHNKAFRKYCKTKFFLVINPDVRLNSCIFKELIVRMNDLDIDFSSPQIRNSRGEIENSYRDFPDALYLMKRLLKLKINQNLKTFKIGNKIFSDWIAGMFILFNSESYAILNGFDQKRYFLYYEDVDICFRAKKFKMKYLVWDDIEVEHNAQRDSHKKIIYTINHLASHIKFLIRFYLDGVR